MGKSKLDGRKQSKTSKTVKAPGKGGGADNAEVNGMGGAGPQKKAAKKGAKRGSKSKEEKARAKQKAKEEKEKKEGKGARKALRHAVKAVVKKNCTGFAGSLMNQARDGNVRSTEIMLSLMEKKKKDGEGDAGWDGLSVVEKLAAEPEWEDPAAKHKTKEKEQEPVKA